MEKYKRIITAVFVVLFAGIVFLIFARPLLNWIIVSLYIVPVTLFFFFVPNAIDTKIPKRISDIMEELSYPLYLMNVPLLLLGKLIIQCNGITIDYSRIEIWIAFTAITLIITIMVNNLNKRLFVKKKKEKL